MSHNSGPGKYFTNHQDKSKQAQRNTYVGPKIYHYRMCTKNFVRLISLLQTGSQNLFPLLYQPISIREVYLLQNKYKTFKN